MNFPYKGGGQVKQVVLRSPLLVPEPLDLFHKSDVLRASAFDNYLVNGLGIRWHGKRSLQQIATFYKIHQEAIDRFDIPTLDFATGQKTHRKYPKAKIIDMVGFIQGQG